MIKGEHFFFSGTIENYFLTISMNKKFSIGFIYVSICILIWGTIGSFVDYPLLEKEIYEPGSLGQLITFLAVGLLTLLIAVVLFRRIPKRFIE